MHMKDCQDVVLAVLEGSLENERTLLVHCRAKNDSSLIELRQQSWGDGVGWFTQSSVQLEPDQVSQLRLALGTPKAKSTRERIVSNNGHFVPRLVTADSA
jgi:hypothetical protein